MTDKTMTEAVQSFAIKKALAYLNSHDPDEAILVKKWVEQHVRRTHSPLGQRLLDEWGTAASRFTRVIPVQYKRLMAQHDKEGA